MKEKHGNKIKIKEFIIYYYETQRGWAIVIMPDEVRIDSFHGFSHMHYYQNDTTQRKIKINSLEDALKIVINYLIENDALIKEELEGELKWL